jgi:hypothetical protein
VRFLTRRGVDVFVEGDMFAVAFYHKFGLEKVREDVLPGEEEEEYGEGRRCLCIPAVGKGCNSEAWVGKKVWSDCAKGMAKRYNRRDS